MLSFSFRQNPEKGKVEENLWFEAEEMNLRNRGRSLKKSHSFPNNASL